MNPKLSENKLFSAPELAKMKLSLLVMALGARPPRTDDVEPLAQFAVMAVDVIEELREELSQVRSELTIARASKGLAVKQTADKSPEGGQVHREVLTTAADVIQTMSEMILALEPGSMRTLEVRTMGERTANVLRQTAGIIK